MTDKKMNDVCNTLSFWEEQYRIQGIPFVSKKFTFNQWINKYKHDYNSMLLSKYLLKKSFNFNLDYHYGGTNVVMKALDKLNVKHDELTYTLGNTKLTMNDLESWNPFGSVDKNGEQYSISLHIDYIDEEDDEFMIDLNDIAILNKQQMLLYLYMVINDDHFVYKSRYSFHKGTYDEYGKLLKIKFYKNDV